MCRNLLLTPFIDHHSIEGPCLTAVCEGRAHTDLVQPQLIVFLIIIIIIAIIITHICHEHMTFVMFFLQCQKVVPSIHKQAASIAAAPIANTEQCWYSFVAE